MKKDTKIFTAEQRERFVSGWEAAGGYTEDMDSPCPWCCPWYHGDTVADVTGVTPEEWGASWWSRCRDEIMALLEEA